MCVKIHTVHDALYNCFCLNVCHWPPHFTMITFHRRYNCYTLRHGRFESIFFNAIVFVCETFFFQFEIAYKACFQLIHSLEEVGSEENGYFSYNTFSILKFSGAKAIPWKIKCWNKKKSNIFVCFQLLLRMLKVRLGDQSTFQCKT